MSSPVSPALTNSRPAVDLLPAAGHPAYLRDLAERLMHVPLMYGTDQSDVSRLCEIARELETR